MKLQGTIELKNLPERARAGIVSRELGALADALYLEMMKDPRKCAAIVDFAKEGDPKPWYTRQQYEDVANYRERMNHAERDVRCRYPIELLKRFLNSKMNREKPKWRYHASTCYLGLGKFAFYWRLAPRRFRRKKQKPAPAA